MKTKKIGISVILAISIGVLVLALDLVSKYVLEMYLPVGSATPFIPGFINLIIVHNDGAAWNSFAGKQTLLIVFTFLIISIFLAYYVIKVIKSKKPVSKTLGTAVGLIAGGCFGNLYDRLVFGYVRDFLNFEFVDFPVFNVADMALTFGIITLLIYFIFFYSKEQKEPTLAEISATIQNENGEFRKIDPQVNIKEEKEKQINENQVNNKQVNKKQEKSEKETVEPQNLDTGKAKSIPQKLDTEKSEAGLQNANSEKSEAMPHNSVTEKTEMSSQNSDIKEETSSQKANTQKETNT